MTPTYSQRDLPNVPRIPIPPAEGLLLGRYHMPHPTARTFRPTIATSRYRRYRLASTIEGAVARGALCAVMVVFVVALALVTTQEQRVTPLNLRQLLPDSTEHFLPTPVAVLSPQPKTGPLAVSSQEEGLSETETGDRVVVINTGGLGALLRAQPPNGRLVASLRDGQVLQVLERRTIGDVGWLRVRTGEAVEGWVFAMLVAPAR